MQHPRVAHGPLWTLPPQVGHVTVQARRPPDELSAGKGQSGGVLSTPQPPMGSTKRVHVLCCYRPLSVYPFVCLYVCDSQERMSLSWGGARQMGEDRAWQLQDGGAGVVDRGSLGGSRALTDHSRSGFQMAQYFLFHKRPKARGPS
jgi:hypothetical protein